MKQNKITKEQLLREVDELDVGQAKKIRLKSFVRMAASVEKLDEVDVMELSKLSIKYIQVEKGRLRV